MENTGMESGRSSETHTATLSRMKTPRDSGVWIPGEPLLHLSGMLCNDLFLFGVYWSDLR